jgi:hypothetical protein
VGFDHPTGRLDTALEVDSEPHTIAPFPQILPSIHPGSLPSITKNFNALLKKYISASLSFLSKCLFTDHQEIYCQCCCFCFEDLQEMEIYCQFWYFCCKKIGKKSIANSATSAERSARNLLSIPILLL